MEKERINTTVNPILLKKLKHIAVEENKRVNQVLEEALTVYFEVKEKEKLQK
jgi:hypothetical protein